MRSLRRSSVGFEAMAESSSLVWTVHDEGWMQRALHEARLAADADEVPVGAVLIHQASQRLIATGQNRNRRDTDPSAHAEIVALRAGAKILGNERLIDCTLYCTLEPCAMCAGAAIHARLSRLVYGAPDARTGACGSCFDLLESPRQQHRMIVRGGVLRDDCASLLVEFFKSRRPSRLTTG